MAVPIPGPQLSWKIDFAQQESLNDVSFGSEIRILATTLPQFSWRSGLDELPRRALGFPAAIWAHAPIQVGCTLRRVWYSMKPVPPALWTLVPAMRESRASGLGARWRETGRTMKSGLHQKKLIG